MTKNEPRDRYILFAFMIVLMQHNNANQVSRVAAQFRELQRIVIRILQSIGGLGKRVSYLAMLE